VYKRQELDWTRNQFLENVVVPQGKIAIRDRLLSYTNTRKRYKLLKQRVEEYLRNKGEA